MANELKVNHQYRMVNPSGDFVNDPDFTVLAVETSAKNSPFRGTAIYSVYFKGNEELEVEPFDDWMGREELGEVVELPDDC